MKWQEVVGLIRFTEAEFQELEQFMLSQYGIDLSKKRTLSECRLSAELEKEGITSLQQFMRRMEQDKTKRLENMMLDKLTTNYTFFMRESKHFDYLRENILPTLRPDNTGPFYRVWSAGCSTGEECYTLSMLFHDYTRQGGFLPFLEITGTDASEAAVKGAKEAVYPMRELADIPPRWQEKYVKKLDGNRHFTLTPEILNCCKFRQMNLLGTVPGVAQFDLIFCRNVMIYFSEDARERLIGQLYRALKPGGYLFVGHTELLAWNSAQFQYICPAVYRK